MDLAQVQGFAPASFDIIFSSNALEHVPDVAAFLRAAWALLKPDGMMIVAVPPIFDDVLYAVNIANPYHLNIWSPSQWAHAFQGYFAHTEYYSHNRTPPEGAPDPAQTSYTILPVPIEHANATATITSLFVLRQPRPAADIPAPNTIINFIDNSFSRAADDRAGQLTAAVVGRRERLISQLHADISQLQARVAEHEARSRHLEAEITAKNSHIGRLTDLIHRLESGRLMRLLRRFGR